MDAQKKTPMEPKKLVLLWILQILKNYSDYDHPLTQAKIALHLKNEHGIVIERKAIGRNIAFLREAGYAIETAPARAGCYLDERELEDSELRLLIDGVLASRHITAHQSKALINKLCGLSNVYFRSHVKNIYTVHDWSKTENQALFYNIELIDQAIEQGKCLCFDYNKYGADKQLHKTASHTASPYQLILHNQRYYLMALNERWHNMAFYRVDRITDMTVSDQGLTPITEVEGYQGGIDYKEIASALPYMYTDRPELVTFLADTGIVDQVVDWFGNGATITPHGEDKMLVSVRVSLMAMEHWAMQYARHVEILTPQSLRDTLRRTLTEALERYQ